MTLPLSRVLDLSAAVVRTTHPALRVIGVASSRGDGDRVELLLRLASPELVASLLMVNVGRASETSLTTELPEILRTVLDGHRRSFRPES